MTKRKLTPTEFISKIKYSLKHENRFIADDEFNNLLSDCFKEKKIIINKGTILFRARSYTENDRYDKYHTYYQDCKGSTWEGYDAQSSFVNQKDEWNSEGRMNPSGIKYLYTATDIETCLAEIKPYAKTLISVAEIEVFENLEIVDFSRYLGEGDSEWKAEFMMRIDSELSISDLEKGDFLFSQYVAEYCKYHKFDGLAYRSSFRTGQNHKNVTIFNYDKCRAISSKLYYVSNVCIKGSFLNEDYPVGKQLAKTPKRKTHDIS